MIRHLLHNEINKKQWDNCIEQSVNRLPYAYSWWLDAVSPGWEALVLEDYSVVMPLTRNRKLGISYLYQPFFTQQLGVFSPNIINSALIVRFLDAIPLMYRYIDIQLNSKNIPVNSDSFIYTSRKNYNLDLTPAYTQLSANYHRNCLRNIQKAIHAGLTVESGSDPSAFTQFIHANLDHKLSNIRKSYYPVLQQITNTSIHNGSGKILRVYNSKGEILASGWFVIAAGRCVFDVCASTSEGKENQAMYKLVDHVIRENAGTRLIFDFGGSDIPGVAYFNAGFGASNNPYLAIKKNLLPWPLNRIKK